MVFGGLTSLIKIDQLSNAQAGVAVPRKEFAKLRFHGIDVPNWWLKSPDQQLESFPAAPFAGFTSEQNAAHTHDPIIRKPFSARWTATLGRNKLTLTT